MVLRREGRKERTDRKKGGREGGKKEGRQTQRFYCILSEKLGHDHMITAGKQQNSGKACSGNQGLQ